MKTFLVKVRLNDGSHQFVECEAETALGAKDKIGWQFVREGVVVHVYPVNVNDMQ